MKQARLLIARRSIGIKTARIRPTSIHVGQRLREWYELRDDDSLSLVKTVHDNFEVIELAATVRYLDGSHSKNMVGKTELIHINLDRCEVL